MNPPNSEPRTTPLSIVIAQIESVCTFDHKLPLDTDASTIWAAHVELEDERVFDNFLFYLLTKLHAYEDHVIQLYSPAGSTLKPRLSKRLSAVARIREGLLSAKSCSWGRFIHIFDDSFRDNLSLLEELALSEFTELEIPDDQIGPIRIRVQDLVTEVDASSLDPQLKELILQNLRRILSSIRTFEFGSTRNLRQTLDAVLAAFFRSLNLLLGSVTDTTELTLISNVYQVISDLDTLTAEALQLPALVVPITQQLLSLSVAP